MIKLKIKTVPEGHVYEPCGLPGLEKAIEQLIAQNMHMFGPDVWMLEINVVGYTHRPVGEFPDETTNTE